MKFLKRFQPQNTECINQKKLNYFEHINILESCNQPGIDNKSSNFISEMVSCLQIKEISEAQKAYTVKCPKIKVMWALRDLLKTCSTKGIQLKYKMILSVKTIGRCGAACLLELKSCVVLMRKLALFVGNSSMMCLLRKFLNLTYL